MDLRLCSIDDLRALRPDLYQAVEQEVLLGKLKLTKDDILNIIKPLSDSIKDYLKPYITNLPTMTYNDIVDMENDIIDEISEQLLNEFEDLENIVRKRSSDFKNEMAVIKELEEKEKKDNILNESDYDSPVDTEFKTGDEIYYKSKRCKVLAMKDTASSKRLVIQYDDGTLDNVPYVQDLCSLSSLNKEVKRNRRSSIAREGDIIKWLPVGVVGKVVGSKKVGSLRKLILCLNDNSTVEVFDNPKAYIFVQDNVEDFSKRVNKSINMQEKLIVSTSKTLKVGDWIKTNFYNEICQVIRIENSGTNYEKLIVKFEDGSQDWIINKKDLYTIIKKTK